MNVNEQHIRRIEKVSGSGHPKKEKAKFKKKNQQISLLPVSTSTSSIPGSLSLCVSGASSSSYQLIVFFI